MNDILKPMTESEKKFGQAIREGKKRNYKKAISLLLEVLAAGDNHLEAYLYLGRAYHAIGDTKRAVLYLSFFTDRCPEEAAGWFFLGRSYLSEGLIQRCIESLEKAIALRPEEPSHYGYIGMAYLRKKDFENAVNNLSRSVEMDPGNTRIYQAYLNTLLLHGIRLFFNEEYDMSNQILEFLSQKGKDDFLITIYLAKSYKELGDFEKAYQCYDKASKAHPDDEAIRIQRAYMLYLLGNHHEAQQEFAGLKDAHPELAQMKFDDAYIHRVLGIKYFNQKEYRKAAYHGVQALKVHREYDLHILVAESYRNLGDLERAKNHYTRAKELKRGALEPYYGIVMTFWEESDYQAVFETLEQILRMAPDDELALYYMTLTKCKLDYPTTETIPLVQEQLRISGPDPFLLTELGNQYIRNDYHDLAPKWYEKAISLNASYEPALYGRIVAYKGTGDYTALFTAYRDYLEKAGYSVSVHLNFINDLFTRNMYKEAAIEVETILPKSRIDENMHRLLAICYRNTEKFNEAAIIYRQLLKDNPDNETYLRSLLYCLEKGNRRADALRLIDSAISFFPDSAVLYLISGVLNEKEKNYEKALESFRKAAELSPNDWKPPYNMGCIYIKKGMQSFGDKYIKKAEKLRAGEKKSK